MNLKFITQNKVLIYIAGGVVAMAIVGAAVMYSNGNLYKAAVGDPTASCTAAPSPANVGDNITWNVTVDPKGYTLTNLEYYWEFTGSKGGKQIGEVKAKSTYGDITSETTNNYFPSADIDKINAYINITTNLENGGGGLVAQATCSVVINKIPEKNEPPMQCSGIVNGTKNNVADVTWKATSIPSVDGSPIIKWSGDNVAGLTGNSVNTTYKQEQKQKTVTVTAKLFQNNMGQEQDTGKSASCSLIIDKPAIAIGNLGKVNQNLGQNIDLGNNQIQYFGGNQQPGNDQIVANNNQNPIVICSAKPNQINVGESTSFSATISGVPKPETFSYQLVDGGNEIYGNGAAGKFSGNGSVIFQSSAFAEGKHDVLIYVMSPDPNIKPKNFSCGTVTVNPKKQAGQIINGKVLDLNKVVQPNSDPNQIDSNKPIIEIPNQPNNTPPGNPSLNCTASAKTVTAGQEVTFTGKAANVSDLVNNKLLFWLNDPGQILSNQVSLDNSGIGIWKYIFKNVGTFIINSEIFDTKNGINVVNGNCPTITVTVDEAKKKADEELAKKQKQLDDALKAAADAKAAADKAMKDNAADAAAKIKAAQDAAKAAQDAAQAQAQAKEQVAQAQAQAQAQAAAQAAAQNQNGQDQNLKPAQDVLSCKMYGNVLALDSKGKVITYCQQSKKPFISAKVYQGAFDPKSGNEDNLILNIFEDKTVSQNKFVVNWNGFDQYDNAVAPGDYTLVVSGRTDKSYNFDYSIQKITVLQSAPVVEAVAAPAAQTPGQSLLQNLLQTPATPSPVQTPAAPAQQPQHAAAPTVDPSKCPGLNYPTDIANHWAKAIIMATYDKCSLRGYIDGTFKPDQPVTRFEAVKMALVSKGIPPKAGCYTANCGAGYPDNIFKDISNPAQGAYIRAAWDLRLIKGKGPGKFDPDSAMTRAEAAVLVGKLNKITPKTGCYTANCGAGYPNNPLLDINQAWQGAYIRPLVDKGILHGTAPNMFEPDRPITRAELVKMLFAN